MKPKEWQKSTRWHFLRGKMFFLISWSKTACLEKDFVLGVDPERTSKEHTPPNKKRLGWKRKSGWKRMLSILLELRNLFFPSDCPFRFSLWQGNQAARLYPCGLQTKSLSNRRTYIQNDCEWGVVTRHRRVENHGCLAGHDASDHCQIIRAWKPRLKSWICCWLKRRCQWWRRGRNELRGQKNDTNGVKCEWWVIFCLGFNK